MKYAGFWIRVAASLIDALILLAIILPLLYLIYGEEYFITETIAPLGTADIVLNYIFPLLFTIGFWVKRSATPGKMLLGLKIVDAKTGEDISLGQSFIRYVGYIVSGMVLMLGYIWVALDIEKQGWHDKMAGTVVVHTR
ncbi:RDD family [Neisseria zoodegmatis]|uniref:RDD family n=3 Tax=Neisseria zoodegmatis TaxID=326523 RepID=A0AB38DUL4_9NEIS|nr:RDD family protein [Neisseria zoodegmatis]SNU80588.1 RDD family [Neisseria zoodegmatis]